ncbi:hypothetical protein DFR52_102264 [Hoeflea marina]|uniref:Uncharacterized protein n=1 Tax=Hoeflea marina TaxID=274592 RepID=A0A317PMX7_9HYPH|nr:hypothetical protein [Hoeflea marina]PWW01601.1 hypothetical protein DFR52_102264 [Hoeflea marina]
MSQTLQGSRTFARFASSGGEGRANNSRTDQAKGFHGAAFSNKACRNKAGFDIA